MKKLAAIALCAGVLTTAGATLLVEAQTTSETKLMMNQEHAVLQKSLLTHNARTMIHSTDIATLVGGSISTDNGVVYLRTGQGIIGFKVNANEVQIAGSWQKTDQGAMMQGRDVYLPLRFTLEKLSYEVKWEQATKTIGVSAMASAEPAPDQNEHSFRVMEESQLVTEHKAFVEEVRNKKGIHQKNGFYVVSRGQVPNPGYGISFVKQEMTWGQLKVYVKLTSPDPGMMYPQVISYPYITGRANLPGNTTISFIDADTNKPLLEGDASTQ